MSDYRKPPGHEWCPPDTEDPADQPNPPGGNCEDLPPTTPPVLDPPAKCPDPDPHCKCPKPPGSNPNCLESLIETQTAAINAADKAKTFKTDLEGLLAKARTAAQDYTRDKYDKLLKQWLDQDREIADLIRGLVCIVPCWHCIIECYICPLLNELHYAEKWLYDDGKLPTAANDLYDLRYWHTRDRDAKERRYLRIKGVLTAWEKPAQTIEKALADNKALIDALKNKVGSDHGKAIYDLFLRLIPMHLAIAPPAGPGTTTRIDKKYTEFCDCNKGTPDDCCGPDVGERSLRDRLIGPQPYLIDPNDYFTVICCLVEKRYGPAKDAWTKAESDLAAVENRINRLKTQLEDGLKNFEKTAKGALPGAIDCCDYEKDEEETQPPRSR